MTMRLSQGWICGMGGVVLGILFHSREESYQSSTPLLGMVFGGDGRWISVVFFLRKYDLDHSASSEMGAYPLCFLPLSW